MATDKAINTVYSTTDYDKFKILSSNRDIRTPHLEDLKRSIQEKALEKPIDVNENFEIIDGQYRFTAWRELKLPILYIIHKGWGEEEIPILNTNQKNWNPSDFVKMYCDMGNEHYIKYKEFQDLYGFTHNTNLLLLRGVGKENKKTVHKLFQEGTFTVTKWAQANAIAKNLYDFKEFFNYFKQTNFVVAYLQLASEKGFQHEFLLHKLRFQSRKLVGCTTVEEYYDLLKEIYNYRTRGNKI
jgi:hypothetical protein